MDDTDFDRNSAGAAPSRRTLLRCMAWAGAGTLCTVVGGVPTPFRLGTGVGEAAAALTFAFL